MPQNKTLTRSSDINHNNLSTNKTSANTHYKNNREKKKIDGLNLYPNVCNLSIHILSMKMKEQIFLIQILRFEYELVDSPNYEYDKNMILYKPEASIQDQIGGFTF